MNNIEVHKTGAQDIIKIITKNRKVMHKYLNEDLIISKNI